MLCGECQLRPPPFEHTICAVDYAYPWDRLMTQFKFQGMVELSAPLADRLLAAVRASSCPLPERLVPVPLSDTRLAERGYNQAWELARRLGRALRISASPLDLTRVLDTPPQVHLSRAQRLANLRAAFVVPASRADAVRGRRIGLIDDVMTTGATAEAASHALLRAGAAAIDLWVVARTPAAD